MSHQSPISPGISWYEASVGDRPPYPSLDGSLSVDVAVVGGGFTGLSAAYHLASSGISVALIEQHRIGDGASGRNGGQFGTGQRGWAEELEEAYGYTRSKALFRMAEDAKAHMHAFAAAHGIDMEYVAGQLSVAHKQRYVKDYEAHPAIMAERYDYPHLTFMDASETADRVGSTLYHGGVRDTGTGHIHPLKFLVGLGRAASGAGALIFENTRATALRTRNGATAIDTPGGTITAGRVLVAVNAHGLGIEPESSGYVMPIGSFIGATDPLPDDSPVLPGGESADDSRFVVRYWRKSKDGRLLFGGREIYTPNSAGDIEAGVRRQIAEVYPALANVRLTHAWGGYVGITMPRKPYVRDVRPGVTVIGGFSGHGVMLSNFTGRLYAESVAGGSDTLRELKELKMTPFPGGRTFRAPMLFLALNWFALRDRF